MALFILLVR